MNRSLFVPILILSLLLTTNISAQQSRITYSAEMQAIGTTGGVVPFWMRSNQYGSIPLSGASTSFLADAKKEYDTTNDGYFGKPKRIDWGMGFEGRVNSNINSNQFILTEAYLKGRLGPFQLKAGRSKETMGLTGDTILSSGSFAVSGNALGIPKIEISFPDYYTLPAFGGLIAVKGSFAHGWLGKTPIFEHLGTNSVSLTSQVNSFLHQKSFYARISRPSWRVALVGGFNHQVFWGNEKYIYGEPYKLSTLKTFQYVVSGKPYGVESETNNIPKSKIGNHLGSIDVGLTYNTTKVSIQLYRQNFYDVGALYYLANLRDGLNGIAIYNSILNKKQLMWKTFLFEFLYTKNQAGEIWSKVTKSGDENYYNNYIYKQGWSYQRLGIGLPQITPTHTTRNNLLSPEKNYFNSNRLVAFHFAGSFQVKNWEMTLKATETINYGTFDTSPWGSSLGTRRNKSYGLFGTKQQFTALLEAKREIKNNVTAFFSFGHDQGALFYRSDGLTLKVRKKF